MSSYRQAVAYTCSTCSHQGTVDTWLVVDVTERPDLVESISDGSIRRFVCEACGTRQACTTSLLVGRPGQRPELLWAPDPNANQMRSNEQFRMSAFMLDRGWTGIVGQNEAAVMPHDVLYAAVNRDVDADATARSNGTLLALDVGMQRYAAWLDGRNAYWRDKRMKAGILALMQATDDADYIVADASGLPVLAHDRWIVLLNDNRPVSAIAPATALDAGSPVPAIIVAPADLDLDAALSSDAFAEAANVSAVVLVDGEAIVGVWSGPSLANVVMQGPTRTITGSVLPGASAIPVIVRSCTYTENGTICATSSSFVSKPFPMPACPNAKHLSAHDFHW